MERYNVTVPKILSVNLAITAILSTWMLQLGNQENYAIAVSLFSIPVILGGLIVTDFFKRFSLSDSICNVLIIFILIVHLSALFRSDREILSFTIANILVYVQFVLFYRKKNLHTCYQLLLLSFLQAGVGCVFDQSFLFVTLLIFYSFAIIIDLILLFLLKERMYYNRHVFQYLPWEKLALDERETKLPQSEKCKKEQNDTKTENRESVSLTPDEKEKAGRRWKYFEQPPKFSAVIPEPDLNLKSTGLLRQLFLYGAWALGLSVIMFYFFPRFDQFEIGDFVFGHDQWKARSTGMRSVVGFNESIVLGELGPSGDNYQSVLSIRFLDLLKNSATTIAEGESVYLRGTAMVQYHKNQWYRINPGDRRSNEVLNSESRSKTDIANGTGDWISGSKSASQSAEPSFRYRGNHLNSRNPAGHAVYHENYLHTLPIKPGFVYGQDSFPSTDCLFDSRSDLICEEIVLEPLSTPIIFAVWPFFRVPGGIMRRELLSRFPDVEITPPRTRPENRKGGGPQNTGFSYGYRPEQYIGYFERDQFVRQDSDMRRQIAFHLYTGAFQDGHLLELLPNQEEIAPFLHQLRSIDENRLSGLIQLARQWDQEANLKPDDYINRAKNIEQRLRHSSEFRYTRGNVSRNPDIDPLEDFVLFHRQGHCEYFAGALAMMLRALDIPSRIIIGFKFTVSPNSQGFTVVRQSDAHSWVEAYIPREQITNIEKDKEIYWTEGGWLRLDATPFIDDQLLTTVSKGYFSLKELLNWVYNQMILNYDGNRQMEWVYLPLKNLFVSIKNSLGISRGISAVFGLLQMTKNWLQAENGRLTHWFIFLFGTFFVLYLFWKLTFLLAGKIRLKHTFRFDRLSGSRAKSFYRDLEWFLTSHGMPRGKSETPREYIEKCREILLKDLQNARTRNASLTELPDPEYSGCLLCIVDAYYQTRFGNRILSSSEMTKIYHDIEHFQTTYLQYH